MHDHAPERAVIMHAGAADAGELLTVQRAAYVTEAQVYGDPFLPALTQTLAELTAELAAEPTAGLALKAVLEGRVVGAVRARLVGAVWNIGRLTVVPDLQGQGLGSRLLAAIEAEAPGPARTHALFTAARSEANLRLYDRAGYTRTHEEELAPGVTLVHLAKPVKS